VVDLNLGKVLKRITGLKGPQDGAYAAGLDLVFVASGGDGEDLSPAGEPIKRKIRLSQNFKLGEEKSVLIPRLHSPGADVMAR
jgi:hypothetical protein